MSKVVIITPPPVHHGQRLEFQKQRYKEKATGILERTLESAGKYADACKDVAHVLSVPCLDMYNIMRKDGDGDFGKFLWDGLHFSKQGHDFVEQQLLRFIKMNFPNIYVTPCPITGQENNSGSCCPDVANSGPYHDEIDSKEYKNSFDEHYQKASQSPSRK
jgi:hypothetical protein